MSENSEYVSEVEDFGLSHVSSDEVKADEVAEDADKEDEEAEAEDVVVLRFDDLLETRTGASVCMGCESVCADEICCNAAGAATEFGNNAFKLETCDGLTKSCRASSHAADWTATII